MVAREMELVRRGKGNIKSIFHHVHNSSSCLYFQPSLAISKVSIFILLHTDTRRLIFSKMLAINNLKLCQEWMGFDSLCSQFDNLRGRSKALARVRNPVAAARNQRTWKSSL